MRSKKIIMILTNSFQPDIRVYKEAKYLVKQNMTVEILCWDRACKLAKNEIRDGIQIKRFHIPSKAGSGLWQIAALLKFIRCIRSYLKTQTYDYLHCHDFDGMLIGYLTKSDSSTPIIFDMHEIYSHYSYAKLPFFKKIYAYFLEKANRIIYVNKYQVRELENLDKFILLPNYPSQTMFKEVAKIKSSCLRINYIGSVRDYTAINTLALVGKKHLTWEINIHGDGVCVDDLRKKVYAENIKIHGAFDGEKESEALYQNTDILYAVYDPKIANWKYAMPVKSYEALITCTPIIAVENTVLGDFVEKYQIGVNVPYGNVNALERAIQKLEGNFDYYLKNLEKISHLYTWETVVKKLDSIYR